MTEASSGGQQAPQPAAGAPAAGLVYPGEKLPFDQVVEMSAQKVYALACRLLGGADSAEDLAQESLIRAFRSYAGFRGESNIDTWLYRITVNTWKNRLRYESRRGFWKTFSLFNSDQEEQKKPVEIASDDPPLGNGIEKMDKAQWVREALQKLDPEERAVVVLRDLEDKTYQEMAVILDIPEGTVKSRLSRARETLRKLLHGKTNDPR